MVGEEEVVTLRGSFDREAAWESLSGVEGVHVLSDDQEAMVLGVPSSGRGSAELMGALFAGGLQVEGISIQPPSLNGLFLRLTGRELRD
jgi:hypothetical protein